MCLATSRLTWTPYHDVEFCILEMHNLHIIEWYILLPSKTQQYMIDRRISILAMVTCLGCYATIIRPY